MFTRTFILLSLLLCLPSFAMASSVKSLLTSAFDAADGRAQGHLSGRSAEPFRIMTMGEAPTELTVHVLQRHEPDCGLVRLTFVQPDALRRDGLRERLQYHMDFNVCRNGMPYVPPEMRDGPRTPRIHATQDTTRTAPVMPLPQVTSLSSTQAVITPTADKPAAQKARSTARKPDRRSTTKADTNKRNSR